MVHESGLPVPNMGLSQEMFGSVLVSNIGSLGIDYGIPALMPTIIFPLLWLLVK